MDSKKIVIPLFIGGIFLVIILSAGGVILSLTSTPNNSSSNSSSSSSKSSTLISSVSSSSKSSSVNSSTQTSGKFKDGTYTAKGSYDTPGSIETIGVTLTVQSDKITSVSISSNAFDRDSVRYISKFTSGISSIVVGKTLNQATLTGRVNGASLTPIGFNEALTQIIQQAQI